MNNLQRLPFTLSQKQLSDLQTHFNALLAWKKRLNLTAIHDPEEIAQTLYGESVALALSISPDTTSIIDVGSGAGFPAVALAVCRPSAVVTMVESDLKKSIFLQESTAHLPNVTIVRKRFETLSGQWNILTSRAVAWSQISAHAATLTRHAALLISQHQLPTLLADRTWSWQEPAAIAWKPQHLVIHARLANT